MPQAIAAALYSAFGSAAFGWGAAYTVAWTVTIAATVEYSKAQKRKARRAADANAKDREIMIRSAIAPRRYIYGRDKVSGPIAYMQSTGDKGQYLHLVVALAAHECDAIEKIYFNEVELPAPDGSGYITSGEFARADTTEATVHLGATDGAGSITLPHSAQSITAAYTEIGVGESATQTHHFGYAHVAGSNTVTGLPVSTSVVIGYTYTQVQAPLVRVRKYLGGAGQTADADLITESGGKWTASHIGAGICYLYVRLEFDQDVFGSTGVPNVSALVRGKKVYDPRTTLTAWSSNSALCVADFLRSSEGFRALSAEVPDSEVITAANICDEEIDLDISGTETQLRYVCDYSYTSEQSPRDVLGDLLSSMAGRAVWSQGRWLVRAGAHRTPTLTITADMLAGQIGVIPKASRSDLFNAVRTTYRDATQAYAEVQAPLVENAGYETEDGGVQIVRQIDIPTLADTWRAQRLAKIVLERSRQALTVSVTCNLRAYDLAPTDTVALTLAQYGWTAKVFEVVERTLTPEGLLRYTLRETAAGVWDWAFGEATIGDLAPDTELPSPFGLPAILQNLSANEDAIRLGDGTIVTQAVVTWDQSPSPFVANGGTIQYQTAKVGTPWGTGSLPGDSVTVTLGPLQVGVAYVFRARAVNASGRAGDWATIGLVAQGLAAPPDDVTGLAYVIKPGQVWVTWDPCDEADYAATELRYDGTGWDDATFLFRGAASDYQHPRPPNGTYTVRAKHLDTSGNYSTNAATLSVTVDDSIDAFGSGRIVLRTDRFPFFQFPDGTSHTTSSPVLIFEAIVSGLTGAVSWTATAYNSSDVSLGAVALTGSGNTRTMTGAQFTAPGVAGSVYYVIVEASIGTVSDSLTVFRADPTITVARIYLSNPRATVPTDAQGLFGDYTDATTEVAVYEGLTLTTDDWSIAITPDAGVTANINGGAGPVTGTLTVDVSVTDMTIPDGAVLVTATKGLDVLTASFLVTKSEASGTGFNAYFAPRSEIILPVNADGSVATYIDAWSELHIIQGGTLDVTSQWTLSKADTNVTSTLTGARVDVTALLALGGVSSTDNVAQTPYPSGWSYPYQVIYGGGTWLQIGYGSTTKVRTSTDDMQTWVERDTGLSAGRFEVGGWVNGVFVLLNGPFAASSSRVITSSDGGVTWIEGTMPAAANFAPVSRAGNYLVASSGSALAAYRTTDGVTWGTFDPPGAGNCQFAAVGAAWAAQDSLGALHTSADSGATWAAVTLTNFGLSNEALCFGVHAYRGLLVAPLYYGFTSSGTAITKILVSADGVTWTAYATPAYHLPDQVIEVSGVLYLMAEDGKLFYTADGKSWSQGPDNTAANATPAIAYVPTAVIHDEWQGSFLPALDPSTHNLYGVNLEATSSTEGAVTVTATKTGQLPISVALPVRKGVVGGDIYTFQASPGFLLLPATADGVVTDWTSASITARANKNGADDTANWSWIWATTNLTPASGTGATATFTAMSADAGQVTFRGSKAGQPDVTGTLDVAKAKGGIPAGPIVGAAFHVIDTTNTWIALKFLGNGKFQVKRGSGGSYADAGQWAGAVLASNASTYWVRVSATGHSLDSGTLDTWLAMTTDREYVLSDATSGTHLTNLTVLFATSSGGANAVIGFGSLQLIVP